MKKRYYGKRKKRNPWKEDIFTLISFGIIGYWLYNGGKVETKVVLLLCAAVAGIVTLLIISKYALKKHKKNQYLKSNLYKIDSMNGVQFEEFLKAHFERKGYKVSLTSKSGDYGVDLVCEKWNGTGTSRTRDRFVVQAKRYKGKIGIAAVQQIIGGMHYYDCGAGMVITNNYFTKNAWELAKKSGVILWDRNKLQKEFDVQ